MASSEQIYNEIRKAIMDAGSTKKPTLGWVAGAFKRTHDFGRIESALNDRADELDPSTIQTLRNTIILRDIAISNGLILKSNTGKYSVTPSGSKFVQDVAKNINDWNNTDLASLNKMNFKQLRSTVQGAKGEADQEWYNSLSPVEQHVIDLYSKLSLKEYAFLKGIKNDKDAKQKYTNRIDTLRDKDPESFDMLTDLRFINARGELNDMLVTKFFDTLEKYDYRHLRSFNRNISSRLDRQAADKALIQNAADRVTDASSPRSSDVAVRAKEFIQSASSDTISTINALSNGTKMRTKFDYNDLKLNGIIDASQTLTPYGQAVAALIKRDKLDSDEQGPLNSRLGNDERQQRRSEILQGRKRSFKDFLTR